MVYLNFPTVREWGFNKWNFLTSLIFSIWVYIKKLAHYKNKGQKNTTVIVKSAIILVVTFVLMFMIIGVIRMHIATLSMGA
jgi:phosphotransferase system  glucose/maltose/N-acetylglucosamine-specific IIC component